MNPYSGHLKYTVGRFILGVVGVVFWASLPFWGGPLLAVALTGVLVGVKVVKSRIGE